MVLWSRRGCSQSMCHVLALLRGVVTLSLPFNPMTWHRTNLRPNGMVSHAMWDKKLEMSVAIDDPKACFTIALCLAWPLPPLRSGCCMHMPSPEVHYTFFVLVRSVGWWRVRPRRRSAWCWLPSMNPHLYSCPSITSDWQSLVVLRRDGAVNRRWQEQCWAIKLWSSRVKFDAFSVNKPKDVALQAVLDSINCRSLQGLWYHSRTGFWLCL